MQINGRVNVLFAITDADRRDARRGTAAAMAIGQAPMPSTPGKTSYLFNVATFPGQTATGASFAHRFGSALPFAVTFGISYAGGKNTGAKVGIAGEF